jgi:hypothetical protein
VPFFEGLALTLRRPVPGPEPGPAGRGTQALVPEGAQLPAHAPHRSPIPDWLDAILVAADLYRTHNESAPSPPRSLIRFAFLRALGVEPRRTPKAAAALAEIVGGHDAGRARALLGEALADVARSGDVPIDAREAATYALFGLACVEPPEPQAAMLDRLARADWLKEDDRQLFRWAMEASSALERLQRMEKIAGELAECEYAWFKKATNEAWMQAFAAEVASGGLESAGVEQRPTAISIFPAEFTVPEVSRASLPAVDPPQVAGSSATPLAEDGASEEEDDSHASLVRVAIRITGERAGRKHVVLINDLHTHWSEGKFNVLDAVSSHHKDHPGDPCPVPLSEEAKKDFHARLSELRQQKVSRSLKRALELLPDGLFHKDIVAFHPALDVRVTDARGRRS